MTAIFQSQTKMCLVLLCHFDVNHRFLCASWSVCVCVLLFGFIVFDMIHKRVSLFCCLVHFGGFFSLDFGRFSAWLQEGCSFMHVLLFSKRIKPKKRHATTISHRDIYTHHADRLTFVALLSLFTSRLVRSRVRFFFIYLYYKIKLTTKISKSLSPFGTILNCVQLQSHIQPNNDTNTTEHRPPLPTIQQQHQKPTRRTQQLQH